MATCRAALLDLAAVQFCSTTPERDSCLLSRKLKSDLSGLPGHRTPLLPVGFKRHGVTSPTVKDVSIIQARNLIKVFKDTELRAEAIHEDLS